MPVNRYVQDRLASLLETLRVSCDQMTQLEHESQRVLQMPADRFMDGVPEELLALEDHKEKLRQEIDLLSEEIHVLRGEWRAESDGDKESQTHMEALEGRVRKALQALQRAHQKAETIVRLRMEMIASSLQQVEQSRRFIKAALQSVAA